MGVNQDQMQMIAYAELKRNTFQIPYQQRGCKWVQQNVEELLKDLWAFVFPSNAIYISALQVAELYKNRRQIELFFKWLNYHLKIMRI